MIVFSGKKSNGVKWMIGVDIHGNIGGLNEEIDHLSRIAGVRKDDLGQCANPARYTLCERHPDYAADRASESG
jgi:hypothetical protein